MAAPLIPGEDVGRILTSLEQELLEYVAAVATTPTSTPSLARQRDAFIVTVAHHCLQMRRIAT
jgi:hypothetical protein